MNPRLLGFTLAAAFGLGVLAFSGSSWAQGTATTQPTAAVNPSSGGTDVVVTTYEPWPDIRAIVIGSVAGLVLFFLLSWFKGNRQLQSEEDVRIAENSEVNEPDAPKPIYREKK